MTTSLLDTSNLNFFYPPRDTPISSFASPTSPVIDSRVCDDCYHLINGTKSSRISDRECSGSVSGPRPSDQSASAPASLSRKSPVRPPIRRAHTSSPRIQHSPLRVTSSPPPSNAALLSDSDLGELESYPLRHASAICKAKGGGRWEPKPVNLNYRIPGSKAPHEIELEREEEERRLRRANPIIRDGGVYHLS